MARSPGSESAEHGECALCEPVFSAGGLSLKRTKESDVLRVCLQVQMVSAPAASQSSGNATASSQSEVNANEPQPVPLAPQPVSNLPGHGIPLQASVNGDGHKVQTARAWFGWLQGFPDAQYRRTVNIQTSVAYFWGKQNHQAWTRMPKKYFKRSNI
jgi:hypothetical protein